VDARLFELEQFYEAAIAAAQLRSNKEAAADTGEMILAIIASRRVEREPSESLLETFARALGISATELRAELTQYAMGASAGGLSKCRRGSYE
jgi:hypothetical protein